MKKLRCGMKRFKKSALILFPLLLILPFITVVLYEGTGTKNLFVVISKRTVAEMGNIAVKVYDPYKRKIKSALLHPLGISKSKEKEPLNNKAALLAFINLDIFLKNHLKLKSYDNTGVLRSRIDFFYQPADEPELIKLRQEFRLDEVVKNAGSDFEILLRLAGWVNKRWEYGIPKNVPFNFNAIEILERAKRGERFFCSEYAIVFIQCALSLGFQGRYVGLNNHVVSEIWLDDYGKWVMLDPTFCIYFRHNGIPLNCLETHDLLTDGRLKEIELIRFNADKGTEVSKEELVENYINFFIRMRNDWFTNKLPHWYPLSNSVMNAIEWSDGTTKNSLRIARETSLKEDLYWTLNETRINISKTIEKGEGFIKLKLALDTLTPNFSYFKVIINGKPFLLKEGNELDWVVVKGENTLIAQAVNAFGRCGRPASIEFILI